MISIRLREIVFHIADIDILIYLLLLLLLLLLVVVVLLLQGNEVTMISDVTQSIG